ncbi:MAG: GTPase [Woeseiaceae bacterium]|nr:GTPase [Woeseiaceae bacterium]
MKLDRFIRLTLGILLALLFVVALAAIIFITESALNVWDRLLEGPRAFLYGYVALLSLLVIVAIWLIVNLLVRRRPRPRAKQAAVPDRREIEQRLREADDAGVDVAAARAELEELAARQAEGTISLCLFGEISSGKSSLIRALVPDADVTVDVVGGSTVEIRHYEWQNADGTSILLTDLPGTAGLEPGLDDIAREEAQRAQIVLFVCDGDLTRAEKNALGFLLDCDKPVILVLNKSDRYSAEEQSTVLERLLDHLQDLGGRIDRDRVVAVSAGGATEVIERSADGDERVRRRQRHADIGVLVVAINRLLAAESEALDERRERAVFRLAAEKLATAEAVYREQRAEQILRSSTRRAVIGALAAVSPGTDVIIQGYIGTTMTRELCRLFGVAPRDIDVEEFLNLSESRAGRALPLALAVAGNGLKAFPGLGTVAGGLVHAVAYGLIFDALGRSLLKTLKEHGELKPEAAAAEFEESIGEHLETRVRQVARLAVAERAERD